MAANNSNPPSTGYPVQGPQEEYAAFPPTIVPVPQNSNPPPPAQPEPAPRAPRPKAPADAPTATTVVRQLVLQREPGAEDDKEEVEDLKQQKLAGDFSGEFGKRVYCKRHYRSLAPIKLIFMLGGRFPFSTTLQADGTYLYKFHFFYPLGLHFVISTAAMFLTVAFGIFNVAHIALNITLSKKDKTEAYQLQRKHEEVLIQRYFIPLIFVYSSLLHGCTASAMMIKKRKYIAHYLTFWSKAVYTMHMDISRRSRGFSVWALIIFVIVVVIMTTLACLKVGPSAIGLPTVFGDLTLRMFLDKGGWLHKDTRTRKSVQVLGALILILTFTASKSSILFFIYHCKSLQSAFAYWNGRVYAAVLRGGEFAQTDEGRTTYKLLFKDHCVLLDLLEGLDQVYAFTVESYFGCQVFSLFFELYFFIRTVKHGYNRLTAAYPDRNDIKQQAYFIRPHDWAPGLLMLLLSLTIMYVAAKSAADVAEESMAGLEVIRRKTMLGRKTDEELYFMLSMFSSYTAYKKMEISTGGYYSMSKDFIIGLISAVLSYFIILYQFQPVMDSSYPGTSNTRLDRATYGKFLAEIEGLPPDHYETTTSQSDFWFEFRS